uniref:phosphatidate phosphatase n=1 Tax=Sus scrofa TaxID=9823 RepID=A0A4X1TRN2_PIG
MNYVGQLAETVFGTVKGLYRGLNPATLSGGIDVLVVKQVDGSFRCSPFHVRFGKLGVLRSREKVVDIEINGEPVDLHMKLGDSGEAFFVQELDSDEEHVPPCLCTSPIPWGGLSEFPSNSPLGTASEPEASIAMASTGRKKKRRRRKPRRKEDMAADSSSEELEAGAESEPSLLEKPRPEPPGYTGTSNVQLEGEFSTQPKDIYPYSDGEWAPQASLSSSGLTSPKSDSELELRSPEPSSMRAESHMQWAWGRLPKVGKAEWPASSMVPDGSSRTASPPQGVLSIPSPLPLWLAWTLQDPQSCKQGPALAFLSLTWGPPPTGRPEGISGRKGSLKRSQHLGPSDIYLDDLPSLDSENAALYFPQSDCGLGARSWSEPGSQKSLGDGSPQQEPEPSPDTVDTVDTVVLSLCGGLADSGDISVGMLDYGLCLLRPGPEQGTGEGRETPEVGAVEVCINEKHYNWAVAAPMILSLQAFQKNLPKSTVDKLEKEKMPRKGGRWWFSWRRRDLPAKEGSAQSEKTTAREQRVWSQIPPLPWLSPTSPSTCLLGNCPISQMRKPRYTKEGANEVVFSVTTQYQGTCRCRATIYLWKWDDKVVISDIDGTITKSDALGHILPQLGKDWTHQGITSLFHKIHLNGYKFLYCSARAIGMADLTKGYLQWVSERGCSLPEGPILLSPSSLFSALHREVIEKKPEVFKIACLSDIQQLFLPQEQPFYAAFGNRPNDVTAYRQVGLPTSRIFTVNSRGELSQELLKNHKYERLSDVVELLFPPVARGPSADLANPEYSNFCYWRKPLAPVDLDALA